MLPNFLGIGAPKSGTTWLDKQLRHHPDIWLAPIKEIHYFSVPSISLAVPCLLSRHRRVRCWIRGILKTALQDIFLNRQNVWWHLRYCFFPRTDEWYASLFSPETGQIAGDVSTKYASMDERIVAKVYTLMPNIKILYLLRNPIHRMWSRTAAFHDRCGYRGIDTIDDQTIMNFISEDRELKNSRYFTNLQKWEKFYPKKFFFVCFYEQLINDPHLLLEEIYEFLELDFSMKYIPDTVHKKVNATRPYPAIPDHFAKYLAQQLYGEIEQLHQRFDNEHTESWLNYAGACLN